MQLNSRQATLIAFVVGLLVGLFVLGWGLFPVEWTNADPWDLRQSAKSQYLTMVAQTFIVTRDVGDVQQRLAGWPRADLEQSLQTAYNDYQSQGKTQASQIALLAQSLAFPLQGTTAQNGQPVTAQPGQPTARVTAGATPLATGATLSTPAAQTSNTGTLGRLLLYAVILVAVIIAGAGVYLMFGQRLKGQQDTPSPATTARRSLTASRPPPPDVEEQQNEAPGDAEPAAGGEIPTRPPVRQTMSGVAPRGQMASNGPQPSVSAIARALGPAVPATVAGAARAAGTSAATSLGTHTAEYSLGDTDYDQSFGLELPNGDYVGECGMGVAELLDGDTSRATAFEVWLFDKSDIRSVTRVVMSEYAFNDRALHDKLASKGDPLQAEPGTTFVLETASLRVQATIEEATYGTATPPNSSFAHLTVALLAYKR